MEVAVKPRETGTKLDSYVSKNCHVFPVRMAEIAIRHIFLQLMSSSAVWERLVTEAGWKDNFSIHIHTCALETGLGNKLPYFSQSHLDSMFSGQAVLEF